MTSLKVGVALALGDGEELNLDSAQRDEVFARYPSLELQARKQSAMSGTVGRLIVIDQDLVAEILREVVRG
jgi:hypothetical protein